MNIKVGKYIPTIKLYLNVAYNYTKKDKTFFIHNQ